MTSNTPIYGIPYPDSTDLVSEAPAQLKTFANGVESALNLVDKRATVAGATPVIATTKSALDAQTGVTGQTGYVYSDSLYYNRGAYYWNGTKWVRATTDISNHFFTANSTNWNRNWFKAEIIGDRVFVDTEVKKVTYASGGTTDWATEKLLTFPSAIAPANYMVFPAISNPSDGTMWTWAASVETGGNFNLVKLKGASNLAVGGLVRVSCSWQIKG
ncbi:hypothetical protein [Bifidobacterium callitrichidarum]|uniref:Tail fiber protein n=1 Tax=Bifidobacterium callitrichidarum TaxID=2052941 RepID=A0A2U2N7T7_9BIFI|nr:hypothetical protein [Bifidobacterium callitrichidarum]PWG65039.1 hypothetical protein DF196_07805 [Bifidobacterium callitrichidarum]